MGSYEKYNERKCSEFKSKFYESAIGTIVPDLNQRAANPVSKGICKKKVNTQMDLRISIDSLN